MKSTKKVSKKEIEVKSIIVYPKQLNLTVKYNGTRYEFNSETLEMPVDAAKYFIESGMVSSTKKEDK